MPNEQTCSELNEKSSSSCSDDEDDEQVAKTQKSSKRTRKISSKTPLASIQESDSAQQNFRLCFGVKSYLHEFYDQSSIQAMNNADYFKRKRAKDKRLRFIWLFAFTIGLICLFTGSSLLAFGFMSKDKPVIIDKLENQMEIIDKYAIQFNQYIESCKVYGLILFIFGGITVSMSLILPSFMCYRQCLYKEDLFDDTSFNTQLSTSSNYNPEKRRIDFKHVEPQAKSNLIDYQITQ